MATLILVIIFIDFIGLGVPDSLLGAAWPAIYPEFVLPVSTSSILSIINVCGTITSSLLSSRLINRFGTAKVTAVSTVLTAIALGGFSISKNIYFLCLFSVPLGLGGGAIDTALNNYVALHYKATHMSFLHCFYGIGVSLSPYLMSIALSKDNNWRLGYRYAFFIQLTISLITIISIPLWKKANTISTSGKSEEVRSKNISLLKLAKMPTVRLVWIMFLCSCTIECTCGNWGSTFLVNSKGLTPKAAAQIITFYYIGMAIGRFLSGILAFRLSSWKIIHIGMGSVLIAVILLVLPMPATVSGIALFMIGLGNGPVFPNLIHLTPKNFGKEISQSVMGSQMAAAYIGVMIFPPILGVLAQIFGMNVFPYYIALFFALMLASMIVLIKKLIKQGLYNY